MIQSLLEITQEILASMDGEEINSITDTSEAFLVAQIVRRTYIDIINSADLPEHYSLFELTPSGDSALPVIMYVPSDIMKIDWVKYNRITTASDFDQYTTIKFKDLQEFLNLTLPLDATQDNVLQMTFTSGTDSIPFSCYDDRPPTFYTTFDDHTLVFDSYDSGVDSTLQKTKTLCYGRKEPTFSLEDDFECDLDSPQYSLLVNEAKAQAFMEAKQVQNPNAERKARRGWVTSQHSKRAVQNTSELSKLPDYGKK